MSAKDEAMCRFVIGLLAFLDMFSGFKSINTLRIFSTVARYSQHQHCWCEWHWYGFVIWEQSVDGVSQSSINKTYLTCTQKWQIAIIQLILLQTRQLTRNYIHNENVSKIGIIESKIVVMKKLNLHMWMRRMFYCSMEQDFLVSAVLK